MWAGIICIILGSVFGLGGIFALIFSFRLKNSGICTTAVLTRKEKVYKNSGGSSINCYYTFKDINGTDYEVKSDTYTITDYVGKEIKIYYDENNPNKKYFLSSDVFGTFFGTLFGIILLVLGVMLISE